jgi:hypothetical protein
MERYFSSVEETAKLAAIIGLGVKRAHASSGELRKPLK